MKLTLYLLWLINMFLLTLNQQCRYVTVPICNGDNSSSGLFGGGGGGVAIKGDKGEIGFSGKSGPKGKKGDIGIGEKGEKGDSTNLNELQEDLFDRLNGEPIIFFNSNYVLRFIVLKVLFILLRL